METMDKKWGFFYICFYFVRGNNTGKQIGKKFSFVYQQHWMISDVQINEPRKMIKILIFYKFNFRPQMLISLKLNCHMARVESICAFNKELVAQTSPCVV